MRLCADYPRRTEKRQLNRARVRGGKGVNLELKKGQGIEGHITNSPGGYALRQHYCPISKHNVEIQARRLSTPKQASKHARSFYGVCKVGESEQERQEANYSK